MTSKKQLLGNAVIHTTAIVTITVFLLWLISALTWIPKINTRWLEVEKLLLENLHFTDLFLRVHAHTDVPSYEGRQVYIVDISEYQTREELTELFDSIAISQPYLAAIDVLFGNVALTDTLVDTRLVESIKRLPNLVLATEIRTQSEQSCQYLHSFFANKVNAIEGVGNLPTSIIRNWTATQMFDGDTLLTFAAVIAQKMGAPIIDIEREWLIDYSIQDTVVLQPKNQPMNWSFLCNQVVLIGDMKDLRDTRIVPVTFQSSTRTQGVMIHKQIIQTILAQHWFTKLVTIWVWVIIFFYLWFYEFGKEVIPFYMGKYQKFTQKKVRSFFKISLICVLLLFAYILFWTAHQYFSIIEILVTPIMLPIGEKMVDTITHCWKKYRKTRS